MKYRLISMLATMLLTTSSCGTGMCLTQAACPDGSWSPMSFADFIGSMMHRDKSETQKTLKEELATGSEAWPSGYRKVPKIGNDIIPIAGDDEGYIGGSVTYGTRPLTSCGTTQSTVDDRIADCAAANSAMATWDGSTSGNSGQGRWKLVSYNGSHEVWRDERTMLIWSDRLGQTNWCRATGSSGGGPYAEADQYNFCNNVTYQPVQATPESWCTEDADFNTPGAYDSMKGGMRLAPTATSPSVVWRLPTKWDYHQAEIDGIRFPLPNMLYWVWSVSVYSDNRNGAWMYDGSSGDFDVDSRTDSTRLVRCVGRPG